MNKAVFLDRDGVINQAVVIDGKPYPPSDIDSLIIIEGVKEGLERIRRHGFYLFVVTNQPDVARGKTKKETIQKIHEYLSNELSIDEIVCCFHDQEDNCNCRKPKPGMILDLAKKWDIDLGRSFMVGDRWRDIEAAKNANLRSIFINYKYDEKYVEPDFVCNTFVEAVNHILQ